MLGFLTVAILVLILLFLAHTAVTGGRKGWRGFVRLWLVGLAYSLGVWNERAVPGDRWLPEPGEEAYWLVLGMVMILVFFAGDPEDQEKDLTVVPEE